MKGYPVFLIGLEDRRCVVVGGDDEAERKVRGLLECDARVTVVSASVTAELAELARTGAVRRIERGYRPGDLLGAFLVIASGQEAATREAIWEEAERRGVLVNVMDDTPHCNFVAGSVLRRGPLTVSISTSGCAPALAVRLRERLEREWSDAYGELLSLLASLRDEVARAYPDFRARREVWYRLVDSDLLEWIERGDREGAHRRAMQIIDPPASAIA